MQIIVDRDSVCAGDDIYNHEMTFEVPESLTVAEFFNYNFHLATSSNEILVTPLYHIRILFSYIL